VNEVNGRDNVFTGLGVCLSDCMNSEPVNQTVCELNAHSSKTVKVTHFKFDSHASRDSPDMICEIFLENGRGHGHATPEIFKVTWQSS